MTIQVVGLFCEDVREEVSRQLTLIGLFPDTLNVEAVNPGSDGHAVFPKLALFVRVNVSIDDPVETMALKLVFPNGQRIGIGEVSKDLIQRSKDEAAASELPFAGIRHHAVMQGFAVPQSGPILGVLDTGAQQITCAVLNIRLNRGVPPTASEQPVSQSPPAAPPSST
jgi:hypothetical protein